MEKIWRIVKKKHAEKAFDGEGARRFGGRWNHEGTPVVYASESLALAALELLVHLEHASLHFDLVSFAITVPNSIKITTLTKKTITALLTKKTTQDVGTNWVKKSESCLLKVPSVLIASEYNFVINPHHPDFNKLKISQPEPFSLDQRILDKLG